METSLKAEKPSKFLIQQSLTTEKKPCPAQGTIRQKGLVKLIKAKENTAVKNIWKLDPRGRQTTIPAVGYGKKPSSWKDKVSGFILLPE